MHNYYSHLHYIHRCHRDTEKEREREIRVAQTMILLMEEILHVLFIPLFTTSHVVSWISEPSTVLHGLPGPN